MVWKPCCLAQGNYSLAALCFHFLLRTRTQVDTNINDTSISPYHNQEDKVIPKGVSQLSSSSHNRDEKNELTKGKCLQNTTRVILWRAVISQVPLTQNETFLMKGIQPGCRNTALTSLISHIQSRGSCVHSAGCLWLRWKPSSRALTITDSCQPQPPRRWHNYSWALFHQCHSQTSPLPASFPNQPKGCLCSCTIYTAMEQHLKEGLNSLKMQLLQSWAWNCTNFFPTRSERTLLSDCAE